MVNLYGFGLVSRKVFIMKKFNISKKKNDHLQRLHALQQHYILVFNMTDREIASYVVNNILPDFDLKAEDFYNKYCSLDIDGGVLEFDDEKKKADKRKEKKNGKVAK